VSAGSERVSIMKSQASGGDPGGGDSDRQLHLSSAETDRSGSESRDRETKCFEEPTAVHSYRSDGMFAGADVVRLSCRSLGWGVLTQ